MTTASHTTTSIENRVMPGAGFVGWLPLAVFPAVTIHFRLRVEPWAFMWALAFAIFVGCKWLTWWQSRNIKSTLARHLAYLFLWPGLNAKTFLDSRKKASRPSRNDWLGGIFKTFGGVILIWGVVRFVPSSQPLLKGWTALIGLVLLLHFGTFQLIALAWQQLGINAEPMMQAPLLSTSLADFWGHRWNSAFNHLAYDALFRPLHRPLGTAAATMVVFLVSGVIHDLVISLPAGEGYGLPTGYFVAQGAVLMIQRSKWGRKNGLQHGIPGRVFTFVVAAGPAFWLFHPPFIARVVLPFLLAIHAT